MEEFLNFKESSQNKIVFLKKKEKEKEKGGKHVGKVLFLLSWRQTFAYKLTPMGRMFEPSPPLIGAL